MPKINVIIPVYNSAETLAESLGSVLAQKGADFEIIAVNDGSTDNSLNLLNEKYGHDSRGENHIASQWRPFCGPHSRRQGFGKRMAVLP